MMNRLIYLFLLLGCTASALVGCTDDPNVEPQPPLSVEEGSSLVTINFGDNSFDEVNITTRATLGNAAESRVGNLFVFIFDKDGNRVYGRYFDHTNRKDALPPTSPAPLVPEECWMVVGNDSEDEPYGTVRIISPSLTDGKLYLLANINSDMVNVSPEKLRFVQNLGDLEKMTASLNQQITERNGFFPMTGWAKVNSIASGSITFDITNTEDTYNDSRIMLTRLDAKVEVRLRVAKGYKATNNLGTKHTIHSFSPLSWQVVNLPRTAFVLPHDTDAKKELFNTREVKFETREPSPKFTYTKNGVTETVPANETDLHGFSFYMLENRPAAKKAVPTTKPDPDIEADKGRINEGWGYHARDIRLKDGSGAYIPDDGTGDIWKYAPAEGTYLIIKGEVIMSQELDDEAVDQQLSADVVYYIHLGDFGGKDTNGDGKIDVPGDVDNYSIERNTSYTYTITLFGVDNIEIEVETKTKENESGATGHVYVAKERIFTFDSHYSSTVVSFDAQHLTDVDNLTWYVRTPFGREGKPHIVNGVEVPAGLDYQWVKFKINTIGLNDKGEEVYNKNQEKYHPKEVIDILTFSKYIKDQKNLYDNDMKDGKNDKLSAFRREFDDVWYEWCKKEGKTTLTKEQAKEQDGEWYRDRLYLTIFVDEFYYDADPLTGDTRTDLWKDFVNKPPRLMHILCDAEKSADEDSRSTGSVVTIRQYSIQTIFNTEKPELKTGWGCETVDETRGGTGNDTNKWLWYYADATKPNSEEYYDGGYWHGPNATNDGNNSDGNGLYNTARIWGLVTGDEASLKYNYENWSTYVDPNQKYGLCDGQSNGNVIRTLRYACMTRNRDEDGDDIIDAEEVKWYMAAISQLGSLYVGDQGLSADAVLYPYEKQKEQGKDIDPATGVYLWRIHIVSSTAFSDNYPEIMWAEEGLATGSYQKSWGKSAALSVRCVRNLGMDPSKDEAETKIMDKDNLPEKGIIRSDAFVTDDGEEAYKFDLTNLNPLSIRYFTSHELEPNNEYSVEARPYWVFETGSMSIGTYTYEALYELIRLGKSPCPDGYRTPNVREGALISLHCPSSWQGSSSRVSTFYSHGLYGTDQDLGVTLNDPSTKSYSWLFNGTQVNLDKKAGEGSTARIRCVRDIRQ